MEISTEKSVYKTVYFIRHGEATHNIAFDLIGEAAYFDEQHRVGTSYIFLDISLHLCFFFQFFIFSHSIHFCYKYVHYL